MAGKVNGNGRFKEMGGKFAITDSFARYPAV